MRLEIKYDSPDDNLDQEQQAAFLKAVTQKKNPKNPNTEVF